MRYQHLIFAVVAALGACSQSSQRSGSGKCSPPDDGSAAFLGDCVGFGPLPQCGANEYGAICPMLIVATMQPPPCRLAPAGLDAGSVDRYYCCPCGM